MQHCALGDFFRISPEFNRTYIREGEKKSEKKGKKELTKGGRRDIIK